MKIAKDSVVSLTYKLTDADGTLLEQTSSPISYLHGGYDGIFPAVEEVLQGKAVGDTFSVTMAPDDAFGEYEHDLVRVEPREMFPKDVAVGMQFEGGARAMMTRTSCCTVWLKSPTRKLPSTATIRWPARP